MTDLSRWKLYTVKTFKSLTYDLVKMIQSGEIAFICKNAHGVSLIRTDPNARCVPVVDTSRGAFVRDCTPHR